METIFFLAMRRMRAPLILLIVSYSVAILGLVLTPGLDADGNPWHMDFFHAFYFVSFMATTIGFGEIPFAFSEAQRLWATFTIYTTVVVWIYSIGTLIGLVQDPAFKQAMTESRFARRIRRMRSGFYLICGYGETGSALVRAITERNRHAVVVEIDQSRVQILRMENLREFVPALCGDASRPVHLMEAGLEHPRCRGVVALTNVNEVNLQIAITSKLLHKDITVICRADRHEVEANMASFGTDHIIDPFDTFALHLSTAFQAPGLFLLEQWLSGELDQPLVDPLYPPCEGLWILCGYGRFGKAVYQRLRDEGLETVVVEATPEKTGTPEDGCVVGWGTEAVTLEEAGINRAVGLVVGTDNDANNLSIIMTAREMNPDLFVVTRQNLLENQSIIAAVEADIVMHPSSIIANKIRLLLATPMLSEFINLALFEEDQWACQLVSRIVALVDDRVPEVWEVKITEEEALAVCNALGKGAAIELGTLLLDSREREQTLECIPLLLVQHGSRIMLPAPDTRLDEGDMLLFCGSRSARSRMEWVLQNENALAYVLTGEAPAQGAVWRWAVQRLHRRE
jgi:Trk K+ transport system NAD-binding subunit